NYPIWWGGHLARPCIWAGKMPTPQEVVEYFFIWKSLSAKAQLRASDDYLRPLTYCVLNYSFVA
ncbi:MAG: hypothetical protein V7K32_15845, partial [Nostoc sp.]|uniref:hypothetical protein n=1 Tax=Nostoc sp. TaxID=1180 RepID=UPI002FFB5538